MGQLSRRVGPTAWILLSLLSFQQSVFAQVVIPRQSPEPGLEGPTPNLAPLRQIEAAFREAETAIAEENFDLALRALQPILEQSADAFLDPAQQETQRSKALTLLRHLPPKARKSYEAQYEGAAQVLKKAALERQDRAALEQLLTRYPLTPSGRQAQHWLAARAWDQGETLLAIRLWEDLLTDPATEPRQPLQQKLAVAYQRLGQTSRAQELLGSVLESSERPPATGLPPWPAKTPAAMSAWLEEVAQGDRAQRDPLPEVWPLPRGTPVGVGQTASATTVGGPTWTAETFPLARLDWNESRNQEKAERLDQALRAAEQALRSENKIAISAARPIVVEDRVIVRTLNGLAALRLTDGTLLWQAVTNDPTLQRALVPLDPTFAPPESPSPILVEFLRQRHFRDQTSGALSADHQFVYSVEDLTLAGLGGQMLPDGRLETTGNFNRLAAYDVRTGRLAWELGGPRDDRPLELDGHAFLGAPLSTAEEIYCLAETQGEVRLIGLKKSPQDARPDIAWIQPLIGLSLSVGDHPNRRFAGLTPALSGGILICPTNSGAVVAVDGLRKQLLWAYQYAPRRLQSVDPRAVAFMQANGGAGGSPLPESEEQSRWLESTPIVEGQTVLVTPRDSDQLHALDLLTGEVRWTQPRRDSLYVASTAGEQVLLVGRTSLRSMNLQDGQPGRMPDRPLEEPGGIGLAVEQRYFLPLASGELAILDRASGEILRRVRIAKNGAVGSLAAAHGRLVMQGLRQVVVFPNEAAQEQRIAEQLAMNPQDPEGLALRGESRLQDGNRTAGLQDLRDSLAQQASPRVQAILVQTLLERLQENGTDWNAVAEELALLPLEPDQERAFLEHWAMGLMRRHDDQAAFSAWLKLLLSADNETQGEAVERWNSQLAVQPIRRWRARLLETWSRLDQTTQLSVLAELQTQLDDSAENPLALERWIQRFSGLPVTERAQARLLEIWVKSPPAHSALLAWVQYQLAERAQPELAGQTVADLAERYRTIDPTVSRQMLQRLQEDFANVEIRDKQTGTALLENWRKTPVWSNLSVPTVDWTDRPLDVEREPKDPTFRRAFWVPVRSQQHAWRPGWAFELQQTSIEAMTLRAFDAAGILQWEWDLPPDPDGGGTWLPVNPETLHIDLCGPLIALSTQTHFLVGSQAAARESPRLLWTQSLRGWAASETASLPSGLVRSRILMNNGIRNGRGGVIPGRLVGLNEEAAIYVTQGRLYAAHPLTGQVFWERQDLPSFDDVFAHPDLVSLSVVTAEGQHELLLLNPIDGSELRRDPLSPRSMRLWSDGRNALWQDFVPGMAYTQVSLKDHLTNKTLWNREFPKGVVSVVPGTAGHFLVLDRSCQVWKLKGATGEPVWATPLPVTPNPTQFWVQSSGPNDLIVYGGEGGIPGQLQIMTMQAGQMSLNGYAAAVKADSGEVVWSKPLENQGFNPYPAADLPILIFAARQSGRFPDGNTGFRLALMLLDKQTGRTIYSTWEGPPPATCSYEVDPNGPELILDLMTWKLRVRPSPPPEK